MADDQIIQLDVGYKRVKQEGIDPFVRFIETGEREFFKAKEFVTLYDLIFKMCIQRDPYNWSEAMYEKYTQSILDYLLTLVQPALNTAKQAGYEGGFLKEWKQRWANHKLIVQGLSKLFMYLDRFYTPNSDGILSLKEQGFKQYKEHVFDSFQQHARTCILNAIERERNGEQQDRHLLQEAVSVYVEMGFSYNNKKLEVYKQELEKSIIQHAGSHYQRKSREWMDQDSAPIYMLKVEQVLQSEKQRVEAYLNRSTLEPLHRECFVQLLKQHLRELLGKKTGIHHLLTQHALDDLARMYRLYKGNDAELEVIAEMLGDHIKKAGTEVVDRARPQAGQGEKGGEDDEKEGKDEMKQEVDEEKTKAAADKQGGAGGAPASTDASADANHALVRNLIALHAQYNEVVQTCFEKAQVMQKALKRAFEDFINKDNRVSKLLAKFVNDVLKKGSKVRVKDIESTLDNVVFLYGYIQEKDVFERDYQCLGEGTRVLMFSGRSKAVEEVCVGDLLMGDDGTPRTVQMVRRGDTREDAQQYTPPAYTYRAGYLDVAGDPITDWYHNRRPKDKSGRYVCCWEECSSTFGDMSALRRHLADFKHPELGAEPAMYRVTGNRGDSASWTCTGKHKLVLRWNSRGWVVSYPAVPATPWALVKHVQSGADGSVHTVVSQTFADVCDAQAARDLDQSLLEAVVSVDAFNASAASSQRSAVMITARQPLGFQLPARRLRDRLAAVLGVAADTISQQLLLDTAWLLGVYCMRGDGTTVVLGDSWHGAADGVAALIQAWVASAPQVTAAEYVLPVTHTPQPLLEEHWCGSAADRTAFLEILAQGPAQLGRADLTAMGVAADPAIRWGGHAVLYCWVIEMIQFAEYIAWLRAKIAAASAGPELDAGEEDDEEEQELELEEAGAKTAKSRVLSRLHRCLRVATNVAAAGGRFLYYFGESASMPERYRAGVYSPFRIHRETQPHFKFHFKVLAAAKGQGRATSLALEGIVGAALGAYAAVLQRELFLNAAVLGRRFGKAVVHECGPAMQALAAEYGLRGERHVPWDLLTEEIPLRRALLAGVMDAEGSYSADLNEYRITCRQREKKLQKTLAHLLCGLGCVVRSCSKEATGCSAMTIAVDENLTSVQPVTLAKRVRRTDNLVDPHCNGFDLQRAEHGVYYAIQIDGNHKHLLEDFTVVHNCFLSHRLLMGLCESEHSEKSMIAKLKTECGYQWTNKLEGMFKDVQLSKEMMMQFRKLADSSSQPASSAALASRSKDTDDVLLEVNVCTTGYWPSSKVIPCKMPKELSAACDKYKRFYLNQHSGHKLEWRFDQGQGEVVVDFSPATRKGLVLSTYQMMILLIFNQQKIVTYKQIVDMTGIPKYEIANHLLSLAHPKVAVLLKKPNNKKLEDAHQFMLNGQYKNALKKVNIPLLRTVEQEDTGEEENKAIELQRRHQMDAAIVRIMKTRKTLRHNLLVAEVISQLTARFKPKPNDIKKRIEALIEQEYMERDKDERGTYNYLA